MVLDGELTLVDPEAETGFSRMRASQGCADGRVTRMKTANSYWLRK